MWHLINWFFKNILTFKKNQRFLYFRSMNHFTQNVVPCLSSTCIMIYAAVTILALNLTLNLIWLEIKLRLHILYNKCLQINKTWMKSPIIVVCMLIFSLTIEFMQPQLVRYLISSQPLSVWLLNITMPASRIFKISNCANIM